jgi:hypothetical protein
LLILSSSSSSSSAASSFSSVSASVSSAHATTVLPSTSIFNTVAPAETAVENNPPSEKEIREKAQKVVANDLKLWQEKFAKAADEGSDELEQRITEITDRMIQNQAQKVGGALNIQLEESVKSSLKNLKSAIITIVESSKAAEEKEEALNSATRKAGVAIKEKAQAVRTWRQSYDRETNSLVSKSAEDTFEILDSIRDLGLQEIGMRWAWTDGITHKDWAKYHKLKTKFDEWRLDVEKVVAEHPGVEKARAASEEVESKAMDTAGEAAKELARLKETGRWKISTGDTSDDWSTKILPAAAVVAGQKIIDKANEASEAIIGTSQGTLESFTSVAGSTIQEAISSASSIAASQASNGQSIASDVSNSASSIASSISSSIVGTPQGSVESLLSVGSASASSLADQASSSIIGTQQGSVESVTSVVKASASSMVDRASSSVIGTSQGSAESIASVLQESAARIADQVSSSVIGTPQGSVESVVSVATKGASSLSAKASSSIVRSEPGVLEKASSSVKSAASVVSDSASGLSDAASSSVSSASSKLSDVVSDGSSSYSSGSSSISKSVSKSAKEASKSASSAASSASSTASKKVWGGAMAQFVQAKHIVFEDVIEERDEDSYSEKIQSMASEAGDRFADITKAVSDALIKPTKTGIEANIETVTVLAAGQYSKALSAASVALYGTEQGTGESISSVASSRYADAISA